MASLEYPGGRVSLGSQVWSVSLVYPGGQEPRVSPEERVHRDYLDGTENPGVRDTMDLKVSVVTQVFQDRPLPLSRPTSQRTENPETMEVKVFPGSLDPEVTRVSPDSPVARVCPDFLVTRSRAKVSQGCPVTPDNRVLPDTPDLRVNPASRDSPGLSDQEVMTVDLVSLATLENLVVMVLKVQEETRSVTPGIPELKASRVNQATQVVVLTLDSPATTDTQELQDTPEPREAPESPEDRDLWAPMASQGIKVSQATQEREVVMGPPASPAALEVTMLKVYLVLPVSMDLTDWVVPEVFQGLQAQVPGVVRGHLEHQG